jgi:hypothetical protein
MSKPSLDSLLVKKGTAAPAVLDVPQEPRKEESKEPAKEATNPEPLEASNQETKVETSEQVATAVPAGVKRKRQWDGQDEWVKVNYEVPKRVQTKLHQLKSWERIPNIKAFVAEALEKALDREIAKAEKEGY